MEDVGLHQTATIRLKRSNLAPSFNATVKCIDLSGDLAGASKLLIDGPANIRAMELAAKLTGGSGNGAAVYLIGPRDMDIVKVGTAADPKLRLSCLQIGNWNELVVHGLAWFGSGAGYVEQLVHKAAKEMGILVRGEWLSTDATEAAELVLKAARYAKMKCYDSDIWIKNWASRVDALAEAKGISKRLAA